MSTSLSDSEMSVVSVSISDNEPPSLFDQVVDHSQSGRIRLLGAILAGNPELAAKKDDKGRVSDYFPASLQFLSHLSSSHLLGYTPIHWASLNGHVSCIEALINAVGGWVVKSAKKSLWFLDAEGWNLSQQKISTFLHHSPIYRFN